MKNEEIRNLFRELEKTSTDFNILDIYNNEGKYWDIKLRLIREITKKYGQEYSPETIKILNIPCAILSIIVEMERERLSL